VEHDGEFAAIARISRVLPPAPRGEVWIGDDAAVLEVPSSGPLLFATDAVVEGVHADLSLVSLADFGWKAVTVNVSDIAAMGGRPVACVVSVAGPAGTDLDRLYEGIASAAQRWQCPVVGGDLSSSPALVVTAAILGDGHGNPGPVQRRGARVDDEVWVTGPLGRSAAGLRLLRADPAADTDAAGAYRRPMARAEAGRLARQLGATAMIDVSDGLTADLGHILDASGVGASLDEIPVASEATLEDALSGGEDYELVFTAPPRAATGHGFIRIGVCTAHAGQMTLGGQPLGRGGWQHDFSARP
jgi:thiamine-monophosphate kinase